MKITIYFIIIIIIIIIIKIITNIKNNNYFDYAKLNYLIIRFIGAFTKSNKAIIKNSYKIIKEKI